MWFSHCRQAPGVEVLTSGPAIEAFAERRLAAQRTIDALGLTAGNAVIIGGAGLALHGINTYVGDRSTEEATFDVDACVGETTFARLREISGAYVRPDVPNVRPDEVHVPSTGVKLPATCLKSPFNDGIAYNLGSRTFDDLNARSVHIGNAATLTPTELVCAKLNRGEIKDFAGVVQAQLFAWETNHPIIHNERWQWDVIGAVHSLTRRTYHNRTVRRSLQPWLGPLVASDFNHPAFTSLNPDPMALRRAS